MEHTNLTWDNFFFYLERVGMWLIYIAFMPCLLLLFSGFSNLKDYYFDVLIICCAQLVASIYLVSGLFSHSRKEKRQLFVATLCLVHMVILLLYKKYFDFIVVDYSMEHVRIFSFIVILVAVILLIKINHNAIMEVVCDDMNSENLVKKARAGASKKLHGAGEAMESE